MRSIRRVRAILPLLLLIWVLKLGGSAADPAEEEKRRQFLKAREEMRTELKRLHLENDQTTVYVTHDQVEAMTLADRIAIMNEGVLQQVGTPTDVYHHPANLFVAQFIGSPVMNVSRATLEANGTRTKVVLGEGAGAFELPHELQRRLERAPNRPIFRSWRGISVKPCRKRRSSSPLG